MECAVCTVESPVKQDISLASSSAEGQSQVLALAITSCHLPFTMQHTD